MDPDPNLDPSDPYVFGPPEFGSDPLVRGMDPDPDPPIIKQKKKKNLLPPVL